MSADDTVHWHGLQLADAVRLLDTNLPNGLSETEARTRLAKYGPNRITRRSGKPAWARFLLQFHQPLIYILIVAGVVTAWLRILAVALAASIIVALEKWVRARVEPHQATAVPWQPVANRG